MNKQKKIFILLTVLFSICFMILSLAYIHLLDGEVGESDFSKHLEFIYNNDKSNYTMYNIILALIYKLIKFKPVIETIYILLLVASKISIAFIVRAYLINENKEKEFCSEKTINTISIILLFIGGFTPVWHWSSGQMYLWFGQPNLWHNPTILFMQPFALLSVIYIEKFVFKNKATKKNWFLLTIFITLSTSLKPSFVFGAVPVCAIIFMILLIKNKFKNFKTIFTCCCAFIPSALVIAYQFFSLYGTNDSSISLTTTGLLNSMETIIYLPLVVLGPAFVYIVNRKKLAAVDKFAILYYIIGFLEGNFITETGLRSVHGNYLWTYMSALNLIFIFSIICFAKNYKSMSNKAVAVGIVLFSFHLICGILYLLRFITTGNYL